MFKKLKRQSVIILTSAIILLIFCQVIVNYISYRRLLYSDYGSKASAFTEMHAENINTLFNQLNLSLSIFMGECGKEISNSSVPLRDNAAVKDALTNLMRFKNNYAVSDSMIVLPSGEYTTYAGRIIFEQIEQTGILDTLKIKDVCVSYYPDMQIFKNYAMQLERAGRYFIYGKTFYDDDGRQQFYVISLVDVLSLKNALNIDEYFTKNTSVYVDFGKTIYTVTGDSGISYESIRNPGKASTLSSENSFYTKNYNSTYDIYVITNTPSNDNSLFINIIKPMIFLIIITVGLLCFFCARLIVNYILNPLENISIKMKHFK